MKKICILFLSLFIIILTAVGNGLSSSTKTRAQSDYLRIHIRANSNSAEDQAVKYAVRDELIDVLTPLVAECSSKEEATAVMKANLPRLVDVGEKTLCRNGFFYGVRAEIRTEEFPTRVYEAYTLPAGKYEALVVELGSGEGDNWWCCIYPPFCFTGGENVTYRSKIYEIIERFSKK